jgi:hypothetical protein
LTQAFTSKNAEGTNASTLQVTGYIINDGDGGSDYTVTLHTAQGTILPAPLNIYATTDTRTYNGTTSSSRTPTCSGLITAGGDTLTGLTQAFTSKNVEGTNASALQVTGYTINDGDDGNDYSVTLHTAQGTLTPAALVISAVTNTKIYDGTTSAASIPTVSGLKGNDTVTNLNETYDTPAVGTGKTLSVATYEVRDSNGGRDYSVATVPNHTGVILPSVAAQLVIHTEPSPTAIAGSPFAIQPVICVEDARGNLITSDDTTQVTASLRFGAGPLFGTTTVTVSAGVARFGAGTYAPLRDNRAETITIVFSSGTLIAASADPIVITPAPVSQIVIHTQPAPTDTAGLPYAPQPVVYLVDRFGNLETGDFSTEVIASVGAGTGPLLGTITGRAFGGIVIFTNLADDKAGTIRLSFTTPTGLKATANPVLVNPAAARRLSISIPTSVQAGKPVKITVTAWDPYDNLATGYRGIVHFTSSDRGASSPRRYRFKDSDEGMHTFVNRIILTKPGTQTITVFDRADPLVRGSALVRVTRRTEFRFQSPPRLMPRRSW